MRRGLSKFLSETYLVKVSKRKEFRELSTALNVKTILNNQIFMLEKRAFLLLFMEKRFIT